MGNIRPQRDISPVSQTWRSQLHDRTAKGNPNPTVKSLIIVPELHIGNPNHNIGQSLHWARFTPVIATSEMTGVPNASESRAVTVVQPAEGPSLGTAPWGTCKCTVPCSRTVFSGSRARRRWRAYVCAICNDSLKTSPSCPAQQCSRGCHHCHGALCCFTQNG
jgi:hypothetical protein